MLDLAYYKRLITSEYRRSPKFVAVVAKLAGYGLDLDSSADNMVAAFDIDHATTAQLDILGTIVGMSRQLSFEPSVEATSEVICPTPEELAAGAEYQIINTPEPQSISSVNFLSGFAPEDMGEDQPLIDDGLFRLLIKARIIQNAWKGTITELYELWEAVMGADKKLAIQDLQDMSFNIVLQGEYTQLERELIIHAYIIPKPEGVRINVLTFVNTDGLPLFSYDYNTMTYSGYSSHWAEKETT